MNHNDVFLPVIIALDAQIKELCKQIDVADTETRRRLYKTRTLLEATRLEINNQRKIALQAGRQKPTPVHVTDWGAVARDLESRFGIKLTPAVEFEGDDPDDDPEPPHAGGAAMPVLPIPPSPVRFGANARTLEEAREEERVRVA
jgi:hypothetical protein